MAQVSFADAGSPTMEHAMLTKRGFSVKNNVPVQLLIIVGSVVLAATLLGSLAWVCCTGRAGKLRKGGKAKILGAAGTKTAMRHNSWSPTRPGSVYDFGEAGSIDGLSLKEKSDSSADRTLNDNGLSGRRNPGNNRNVMLSPASPMPTLNESLAGNNQVLNDRKSYGTNDAFDGNIIPPIAPPAPVAATPIYRGRGWQLFDGQPAAETIEGVQADEAARVRDVEAGGLPPARRPSFIDRLLAHRSLSHANAAKMASNEPFTPRPLIGGGGYLHERSFTTPTFHNAPPVPPSTPGLVGSALLSAIGGAFRRASQQHHQFKGPKKFAPSPRQFPIESDYEGTIGGKDTEIPMARRADQRRPLCGESINTPSVAMDAIHAGGMTPVIAQMTPRPFMRSPLGMSQVQMASTPQRPALTPFTPGMAGVGTTWPRRMSETAIPTITDDDGKQHTVDLSDIKRQQDWQHSHQAWTSVAGQNGPKGRLSNWVLSSTFAAVPPPDEVSRRGSDASFVISERSMPSVSRQNSVAQRTQTPHMPSRTVHKKQSQPGLQRNSSLNPRFATMKTLSSFLEEQQPALDGVSPSPAVAPPLLRSQTLTTEDEKRSIIEKYFEQEDRGEGGSNVGSQITDYDQQRGMLWEDVPTRPPSYRTNPSSSSIKTASRGARSGQPNIRQADNDLFFMSNDQRRPGDDGAQQATAVWSADRVYEDEAKRKTEKRMRKRMREARRTAKRAAKEAAMAEANNMIVRLPAVQDAMLDQIDTTTSDSSKAKEQALRHRVLDKADAPSSVSASSEAKVSEEPAAWVAELLMHTPDLTHTYKAPVLAHRRSTKKVVRRSTGAKTCMVGGRRDHQRQPPISMRGSRRPVARLLSPPESPLTSASEYPSCSERRASMPAMRSFLVESRRGSQESKSQYSQPDPPSSLRRGSPPTAEQEQPDWPPVKRVVSMPAIGPDVSSVRRDTTATPARRRLPSPPPGARGGMPISAFDQLPSSVYVA